MLLVLSTFERNTECTTNIIHDQVFSFTFVKFKMEGITQAFSPKSTIFKMCMSPVVSVIVTDGEE